MAKSKKKRLTLSNLSFKFKMLASLLVILLFSGVGAFIISKSSAEAIPSGAYSNYTWSAPTGGFGAMQHELTIESIDGDPTYFWSHQMPFINGDGGYIGLQSHGSRVNGTVGRTAVFSIFSAGIEGLPTQNCKVEQAGFDGYNTSGTSCRIPYEWVIGHKYQMTVVRGSTTPKGTQWEGWIKDTNTGVDTNIATITVPSGWQGIGGWTSQWTEYFGGHPANCVDLPLARVRFSKPRTYQPATSPAGINNNANHVGMNCTNSIVEDAGDSVIQQIGGNTNTAIPATDTKKSPQPPEPAPTPAPSK